MIDMTDKNSAYAFSYQIMIDMTDKNSAYASRSRHASPTVRRGERERARVARPFSFYQLHKWYTVGPTFKSVKILIDFQCGNKSLAFICGPFNS
jgi:hypothetical protein